MGWMVWWKDGRQTGMYVLIVDEDIEIKHIGNNEKWQRSQIRHTFKNRIVQLEGVQLTAAGCGSSGHCSVVKVVDSHWDNSGLIAAETYVNSWWHCVTASLL